MSKIHIDTNRYCIYTYKEKDLNSKCDHIFEQEPTIEEYGWSMWECKKCKGKVYLEEWD